MIESRPLGLDVFDLPLSRQTAAQICRWCQSLTMRFLPILACSIVAIPAYASTISGPATVIDGDSLSVSGISVRLFGIDAPEGRQGCTRNDQTWPCGEESATQLKELIGSNSVSCEGRGNDEFGRMLAICRTGQYELNKLMVESGWATAFEKYSNIYAGEQQRAKDGRLGIWDSTFVSPEEFRHAQKPRGPAVGQRSAPSARVRTWSAPTGAGCAIKGNRNRKGEWIYHVPGMPYYGVTRPEEIFCTEAEAREAGYRRAIVRP